MNNKEFRQMLLAGICFLILEIVVGWHFFSFKTALFFSLFLLGEIAVFYRYTKKRYDRLQDLNTYLSGVLSGDYDLQIGQNEEGELSILQNNIYKATILLKTQNEKLEKDKKYLANVMADISHQLKTPLTSMSIMSELLEASIKNEIALTEDSESQKRMQFIEIQRQQMDKMNWLVQNLLKLSKLDAGIVEMKEELLDIRDIIEESLTPFLIPMDLAKMQWNFQDQTEEKRPTIRGDKNWTVEAFRNIIKNCVEHMEEEGRLSIWIQEERLYLSVHIEDNGCGILPEDLPHIFERFYRGKDAGPGSIGIGLALAKAIVEKESGQIRVESQVGVGTRFEVRFYHTII